MNTDKTLKQLNKFVRRFGYADDFKLIDQDSTQAFFELARSEYMVTLDKQDGMLYAEYVKHIAGTYYDPPDQDLILIGSSKYAEDVCESIFKHMLDEVKTQMAIEQLEE